MDVCFDKEPLGHFFPTEPASAGPVGETAEGEGILKKQQPKSPDMFLQNLKI